MSVLLGGCTDVLAGSGAERSFCRSLIGLWLDTPWEQSASWSVRGDYIPDKYVGSDMVYFEGLNINGS